MTLENLWPHPMGLFLEPEVFAWAPRPLPLAVRELQPGHLLCLSPPCRQRQGLPFPRVTPHPPAVANDLRSLLTPPACQAQC